MENIEDLKYRIKYGLEIDREAFYTKNLSYLLDKDILSYLFHCPNIFHKLYSHLYVREAKENFLFLFQEALLSKPKIKDYQEVFQVVAEKSWINHSRAYNHLFEHVYLKVCNSLRTISSFDFIHYQSCVSNMKKVLGDKFQLFYIAMQEYFTIYHSDCSNKLELLRPSQDIISKMSALYVAKEKEKIKAMNIKMYLDYLKPYYTIRKEHPLVKKRVLEKKQKELFRKLYIKKDIQIKELITRLKNKYSSVSLFLEIEKIIDNIVLCNYNRCDLFMRKPQKYDVYLLYLKVCKLINRLNNGYIQPSGKEVGSFLSYIKYNDEEEKYVCQGIDLSLEEIEECKTYSQYEKVFTDIMKEIMLFTKSIDVGEEIDVTVYDDVRKDLPFNDAYFVFDLENNLKKFTIDEFVTMFTSEKSKEVKEIEKDSFLETESLEVIKKVLVEYGFFWLFFILQKSFAQGPKSVFNDTKITSIGFIEMMREAPLLVDLSRKLEMKLENYSTILRLYTLVENVNDFEIDVLGFSILEQLTLHLEYTDKNIKKIFKIATELVCQMMARSKSTVPLVSGKTKNYTYEMYDLLDVDLLLSGIKTYCCFKIGGVENDFLHYCALDTNGFILKFSDLEGNFLGKASGFRNGNAVYINQLCTVFDTCELENQQIEEIIEVFYTACRDIIISSQNCEQEKDKIEYVFVNQYGLLDQVESCYSIPLNLMFKIGDFPIYTKGDDWKAFIRKTKNLLEIKNSRDIFLTDFVIGSLMLMVSGTKKELSSDDIRFYDAPACYERKRGNIISSYGLGEEVRKKIFKIKAIYSYYFHTDYSVEKRDLEFIKENVYAFVGEDWYILWNGENIIDSCFLGFDARGVKEYESTLEKIKKENKKVLKGQKELKKSV